MVFFSRCKEFFLCRCPGGERVGVYRGAGGCSDGARITVPATAAAARTQQYTSSRQPGQTSRAGALSTHYLHYLHSIYTLSTQSRHGQVSRSAQQHHEAPETAGPQELGGGVQRGRGPRQGRLRHGQSHLHNNKMMYRWSPCNTCTCPWSPPPRCPPPPRPGAPSQTRPCSPRCTAVQTCTIKSIVTFTAW